MSDFSIAALWCILQVTLLTLIAIAATQRHANRNAGLGARFISAILCLILATTCFVCLPLGSSAQKENGSAALPKRNDSADALPANAAAEHPSQAVTFNLQALRAVIAAAQQAVPASRDAPGSWWIAGLIVILAAAISFIRLVSAVRFVRRIHQTARPVDDADVTAQVKDLSQRMAFNSEIRVLECDALDSAAAFGFRRPAIALPGSWHEWNANELRAVLAHEIAHLSRGDCRWRILSVFVQTLHAYHPLIYWLGRRLRLLQELAADRIAADALGSQRDYVRALAQIVLRQPKPTQDAAECLLPVFSGDLIRRINMLRSTESSSDPPQSRLARLCLTAAVFATCCCVLSLRLLAQSPPDGPATHIATGETKPDSKPPASPVEAALLANNEYGMLIVRTDQLKNEPALALIANSSVNEMLQFVASCADWEQLGDGKMMPQFDLGDLEYIAARLVFSIRRRKVEERGEPENAVMFSANLVVLKFNDDVKLDEWIQKHMPKATQESHDGATFYELPPLPMFGPIPILVAAVPQDSRKIVLSLRQVKVDENGNRQPQPPTELCNYLNRKPSQNRPRWMSDWEQLRGGMISIVCSDKQMKFSRISKNGKSEIVKTSYEPGERLFGKGRTFGLRIDPPQKSGQITARIQIGCDSAEDAKLVKDELQQAVTDIRKEFGEAAAETHSDAEKAANATVLKTLESSTIRIEPAEEGRANVTLDIKADLNSMLGFLLNPRAASADTESLKR